MYKNPLLWHLPDGIKSSTETVLALTQANRKEQAPVHLCWNCFCVIVMSLLICWSRDNRPCLLSQLKTKRFLVKMTLAVTIMRTDIESVRLVRRKLTTVFMLVTSLALECCSYKNAQFLFSANKLPYNQIPCRSVSYKSRVSTYDTCNKDRMKSFCFVGFCMIYKLFHYGVIAISNTVPISSWNPYPFQQFPPYIDMTNIW